MEQILMSSPGSHTDWDGDQSSLGFMLLDSNDPVTPCGNEETDKRQLRFEEGDRNVMSLSLGEIFSENALNLDDLFRTPQYSGVEQVFPWEQDAEPPASHWESQLSCSQNIPPSEHGEHLEESASPCSNASPAITSSVQQWAEDATDILESPRVCTVSLIAGDSTGDVEQEQGNQLSDVGGALGEACSANQTPAQLEGHQGEGEALTLTQASPEQRGSSESRAHHCSGPWSPEITVDQDGDGFVRMEEFLEFAAAYGAEQVKDLTRFLDPSGLGVISFEDFHRGITAISNGGSEPDLYRLELNATDARLPAEEYDEQAEVSDSVYLGSESAYSECETFTDEDTGALAPPELHEDVETDSGIENTLTEGDDHRNRFSLGADIHGHALSAVIGGEEEHFEDFGESNTSDLLLANHEEERPGPEDAGDPEPHPHPGSPKRCPPVLSPSGGDVPASLQALLQSEALDFFCSHCHKQISRLEDLSTRLHLLEMNSSGKRLSSKKAARLLQNSALGLEGMGDLSHGLLDLTDTDITDKMLLLERRVCELEQDSALSEEQHSRLRQENLTLVHRANALEEQLKEQELRADDTLHTHTRKHRDAMAKLQRERDLEIENLQARLQQLDEENSELRSCVPCLRANIERLEEEKRKLQDEVEDMSERLNEELDSRRKMTDKLSHERHNNQKEKECMQELIEDLRKQLEHLQLFKLEMEAKRGRSPSAGLQEYNTRTREHELEQEIRRLKQDNRSLKEQNDELNGQIINLSIQGAKSLVSESFSESLAAEINSVSRSELMEAIHKQKEINFRLQDYIDRIIVAIMESNPSILEVK
ncbi:rab11 family-interacting protein 3 [Alosa alosa]|uniref:rab11 family-interacting protein 3 n=1 Tax=Alosa alosa TaxID=278164 RepID=UPI0020155332|nr:rab11 family-interacting protein 3 [Alosa alosa]